MRRLAAAAFAAIAASAAAHGVPQPEAAAFEPPRAGTYALPAIQPVADGEVLDASGRTRRLADFTHGRITLLGLVYTRCADADGCPRATWAFSALRTLLREAPELESRVRLVTLSFDPVHDTPARLAAYARRVGAGRPGVEWRFLTTRSRTALDPILEGLGQDMQVETGSRARPGTEAFTHTLKVFLIDPAGRVREIYGTAFLMPAMLLNDVQTLYSYADIGGQEQTRLRSP